MEEIIPMECNFEDYALSALGQQLPPCAPTSSTEARVSTPEAECELGP